MSLSQKHCHRKYLSQTPSQEVYHTDRQNMLITQIWSQYDYLRNIQTMIHNHSERIFFSQTLSQYVYLTNTVPVCFLRKYVWSFQHLYFYFIFLKGKDGYAGKSFQVVLHGLLSPATSKHRLHVTRADYLTTDWELNIKSDSPKKITLNDTIFIEEYQCSNKSINIIIDSMVDVYVRVEYLIFENGNYLVADIFNYIPVSNLGEKYYVLSQCHSGDLCVLSLIGTGNDAINLNVTVTSTSRNVEVLHEGFSYRVGDTIKLHLIPNEVVYLQSLHDLSGTRVSGDNKFSVYSGVFIETSSNRISSFRQLPPIISYGKYFTVNSRSATGGDLIKILVTKANTQIDISSRGDPLIIPHPGMWIQRFIPNNRSSFIFTSKPVLLVQYEMDRVESVLLPRYESMLIIPPIQQWPVRGAKFAVTSNLKESSTVSILTHSKYINDLLINGRPGTFTAIKLIERSGYKVGDTHLESNDTYMVKTSTGEVAIWGYVTSTYRYPFYSNLKTLNIVSFI